MVATLRYYSADDSGLDIAAGIWIIVTGLLGICSCKKNQNLRLHDIHMSFCIITVVGSFANGYMLVGDLV